MDAERTATREVGISGARHVAVGVGRDHWSALQPCPAMALVTVFDTGVVEACGVTALDARRGRVVRVLRSDVASDDA